jgi:hypothetical protein
MKTKWSVVLGLVALGIVVGGLRAEDKADKGDKKEITLKGAITCAKCELNQGKKCQTVILVKEGGKEVTYYFKDKGSEEEYHESVCGGGRKEGTVKGIVSEKDGKKWVTPSKVEYAKK